MCWRWCLHWQKQGRGQPSMGCAYCNISYSLIGWFCFSALIDRFQSNLHRLTQVAALGVAFVLLQMIVLLTTIATNLMLHWGVTFILYLNMATVVYWRQHTSQLWRVIGWFCLRYMYMRDQWLKQQYSELNARIQAMQARIHPFLFNSLNNVVSLISIDPKSRNLTDPFVSFV